MKKVKDLAVKTGTYQKDGQTKNRYMNVGIVMRGDDGNEFIFLERTFNPAGVPNPDGKSTVLVSMFDVKDGQAKQEPVAQSVDDVDSIPF